MIKNDENKKVTGSDISNELNSSTRPTSFQKMKYRKDAKGNLILKKKMAIKRTKHHVYFMDDINKKKPLVTTIEIESYKKYNLEGDEEIQEEIVKEEDKQPLGETQVVKSNGCCCIFQLITKINFFSDNVCYLICANNISMSYYILENFALIIEKNII